MFAKIGIATAALLGSTEASKAVDVSQPCNNFSGIHANGVDKAIVRAYLSYGHVDSNAPRSLKNAKTAGLSTDVYLFPCASKDPTAQMNELVSYLDNHAEL
jgi:hypothetical protein